MKVIKLPKEVDKTALAKRVLDTGMVGNSGEGLLEVGHPTFSQPSGNEINFIQDKH